MKILPALFVALGLVVGLADAAYAAAPKKKPVASKKAAKPVARVVKKKSASSNRDAQLAAAIEADNGPVPKLASGAVAVIDQATGDVLFEKNANAVVPIASITKLMMSSENRAASALSRHYPGGREAFIAAMNAKAHELGLTETRFSDPTGLTPENVSSARDLVKMVNAAHQYPLIREFSTSEEYQVAVRGRPQTFRNTNALVKSDNWTIGLSKTGYISEAGKCLVMQAWLNNKPTIIVLLDSWGKLTRIGDANRIKRWVESVAGNAGAVRG